MRNRGFTLIDTVMVMVIIGILVGLAIPNFESFYAIKLSSAARRLASDIRYAQRLSVARYNNDTYGVQFNTWTNRYWVYPVSNPSGYAKDPLTRGDYIIDYSSTPSFTGIDLVGASFGVTSSVRFTFMGVPQDGNGTDLVSNGSVAISYQGYSDTVVVSPVTGNVQ